MLRSLFRRRKYKKMIKGSSSFILEEFAKIVTQTIEHFDKEGLVNTTEKKEALKFEAIALSFWVFSITKLFEGTHHKLILDEIHNQYYNQLRKNGYGFELRQKVCEEFNLRYRTYDNVFMDDEDFTKVGIKFIHFLSKKSNTELDIKDLAMPLYIVKKIAPKFEEWKEVMKN